MKKIIAAVKKAFSFVRESHIALYAGSWSFFFLLSAVPLVLLLVMACDAFGVDLSFLLEGMPPELGEGVSAVFSLAADASKGATFILVLTSVYSASRLFSRLIEDGGKMHGVSSPRNGVLGRIAAVFAMAAVFAVFLAAAGFILLGRQFAAALSGSWGTLFGKIALNFLAFSFVYAIIITLDLFICPKNTNFGAVLLGALVTLAVGVLGSIGFAAYVHYFASYTDLYGNLAAIVVLMLWVYITMIGLAAGNAAIALITKKKEKASGGSGNQKFHKDLRREQESGR